MSAKILSGIYLLIVGMCIGGIVVIWFAESIILDADAIFRNNEFSTTLITKYDQGIILSCIVAKFGYMLVGFSFFIMLYETLSYKFQKSTFFVWICNILNGILMLLFGLFYAPGITKIFEEEPKIMASPNSESFFNQSELILKLLFLTLIISFFSRIVLTHKKGVGFNS